MTIDLTTFPKREDFDRVFEAKPWETPHAAIFAALDAAQKNSEQKIAVSYGDTIMPGIMGSEYHIFVPVHPNMELDEFEVMARKLRSAKIKQDLIEAPWEFLLITDKCYPEYMFNYELVHDKGETKKRFLGEIAEELQQSQKYYNSLDKKFSSVMRAGLERGLVDNIQDEPAL